MVRPDSAAAAEAITRLRSSQRSGVAEVAGEVGTTGIDNPAVPKVHLLLGTTEKAKSTAAQLVSAIEIR
jgi:hypothetical protein